MVPREVSLKEKRVHSPTPMIQELLLVLLWRQRMRNLSFRSL
jgi:hypothetical protein